MKFSHASPESRGISSKWILDYVKSLDEAHLAMHNLLIARGSDILYEAYYSPFHENWSHRQYSVTKSFVALAIGFALQDGLLSLDDPMSHYFAKELEAQGAENSNAYGLHMQTVRNMLMMSTAKSGQGWFSARSDDRVRFYFENTNPARKPGERFEYDSSGTFILGALVERLTGKTLMAYLRDKLFDKIGVSDKPSMLLCPGGHSWGDSALLMPQTDMLRVARFVLNGGSWDGEQILSADYLREATAPLIPTAPQNSSIESQGYGYYIWHAYGDGFFFNGMGCQFALCIPETDLILLCNADNQGNDNRAIGIILDGFYHLISNRAQNDALPPDSTAVHALDAYTQNLRLFSAYGNNVSPMTDKINGAVYTLDENRMGIQWLSLSFDGMHNVLTYENAQGRKVLPFGMCANIFADFPQEGYSDKIGSMPGSHLYHGAYSAAWTDENTLWLKVQIIDDYFGNMDAVFAFSDDGSTLQLTMKKTAEDFLNEYSGNAVGHRA